MRPGSAALVEALQAGERHYAIAAHLGGRDISEEVAEWEVDRSYDTGLPAQVAFTTGAVAAQAKLTLVGDGTQTAAQRYSPWSPRATADITRPGQSAVISWGLTEGQDQVFRGRVRRITADARGGSASLTALDGAELLRGPAWLPPVMDTTLIGVSTAWCIDHALRMNGIHNSPPQRPGSIFFASMNTGVDANIGMRISRSGISGFNRRLSPWTAGPHSTSANGYTITWAPQRRVITQQGTLLVDWWVLVGTDTEASSVILDFRAGESGTPTTIECVFDPTVWTLRGQVNGGSSAWSIPAEYHAHGRHKVTFEISFATLSDGVKVRAWLTGPTRQFATPTTYTGDTPVFGWLHTITASSRTPMECVDVARLVGTEDITTTWAKTADILPDASVHDYRLRAAPNVSGTWWDMLKDIADAQLLYMGFDEDGVFRIHARDYMSPDTQARPDLTITAARDLAQIITSEEIDGIANIVEVAPTAYEFQSLSAEDFYTDDTVREIPPRGTLRVSLDTTGRGWMTPCPMPFSTSGSGTPDASRVKFLTKEGKLAPVEVELVHSDETLTAVFHNRGVNPAYTQTASNGGDPSLVLARHPITTRTGAPAVLTDSGSIDRYGQQALQLASPWVQFFAHASTIGQQVLRWTAQPIPLTGSVEVLPDPRIQLGDVVRLTDSTGSSVDGLFRVLGIRVTGRGPEVRMTLDVRPMYRPSPPADAGLTLEPIADPAATPIYPG